MLTRDEMRAWLRSVWSGVRGASTRGGHPAPFPVEIAERLIRLFSFAGDVVLDPFAGTGTTTVAAMASGRNSVGADVDPGYVDMAERRARSEAAKQLLHPVGSVPHVASRCCSRS